MTARHIDQALLVILALVCSVILGCNQRRHSMGLPRVSYFSLMERAFTIERNGDFPKAKPWAQQPPRPAQARIRRSAKMANFALRRGWLGAHRNAINPRGGRVNRVAQG